MNLCTITFDNDGDGHCLYTEEVDLATIGPLQMERASNIEFNQADQQWEVRLPDGRILFRNLSRSICLNWEQEYFNR